MQLYRLDSPASPFTLTPGSIQGLPPKKSVPGKVRLVKDVLSVGTYKGWKVTPKILDQITENFRGQKGSGIRHPYCWGHGNIELGIDTDERDSIDDVDEVWSDGKTLWSVIYTTPENAKILTEKRREVSITAVKDWQDATGKTWKGYGLLHVAVVTHASVPGQDPFIELSAPLGNPMTFDVARDAINTLAKAAGYAGLPAEVDESNFDTVVPALVAGWTGKTEKEDPMADAADKTKEAATVDKPEPVTMAAPVSAAEIATLNATVANLTKKLEALESEKATDAKNRFESQVTACLAAGLPAANKDTLIKLGADLGYSETAFTTLNAFASSHRLTLGSQIHGVVTPDEPKLGISDEDKDAALVALGKQPRKKAS